MTPRSDTTERPRTTDRSGATLSVPPALAGKPTERMKESVKALTAPAPLPSGPGPVPPAGGPDGRVENGPVDADQEVNAPADAVPTKTLGQRADELRTSLRNSLPVDRLPQRRQRIGGVAPAVRPKGFIARVREGRLLERRGFVALSPGRTKRRHRILPRTVIGISFMLLSLALGAAFAGAGFYAYYDNRLAANEQEIARFVEGFDEQFVDASDSLNQLRGDSLDQIRRELQPLSEYVSEQNGVVELPAQVGPSVYQLRTTNEAGTVVAGSAAAVAKHQGGTAFVTSYALVKSGTIKPAPGIELVKGDEKIPATLWSWDAERDLALVVAEVEVPRLVFGSNSDLDSTVGAKVFAISGTGGQGATASPGTVLDRSAVGFQHTAAVGVLFNGGPLVSSDGKLVGVASLTYAPLGFTGGDVRFATDLTGLCTRLLNCADPVDPQPGEN